MPNVPYTPPTHEASSFNCPHCSAYAAQLWGAACVIRNNHDALKGYSFCICSHCKEPSFWIRDKMVHPDAISAPKPNADLPSDIQEDYNEARQILAKSPRGASALLRLCIQKICKHLGENGKNINNDIASLVKKGLPVKVQQALDTVRVVGNNAVHPGQIDLKDDIDTAGDLFHLINVIADVMITQPKQVDNLYQRIIPKPQRDAIKRRDST